MSLSRKVVMGREQKGTPWTFDTAKPVPGDGYTNQWAYEAIGDYFNRGLVFNSDGTIAILLTGDNTDWYLWKFSLDEPYIMSTATRTQTQKINDTYTGVSLGPLRVTSDGTTFHFVDNNDRLYQVEFTTGWDLSSSYTETIITSVCDPSTVGYTFTGNFNGDGTKYYCVLDTGTAIKVFNLTTAYDLSSGVTAGTDITSISGNGFASIRDSNFSSDGSVFFIHDANKPFSSVELTTAYDLTTLDWNTLDVSNLQPVVGAIGPDNLGDDYFMVVSSSNKTRIFHLNHGVSSVFVDGGPTTSLTSYQPEFASKTLYPDPTGNSVPLDTTMQTMDLIFNADGTEFYKFNFDNNYNGDDIVRVLRYNLTTAYDLSTASYFGVTNFFTQDYVNNAQSVNISLDGKTLTVVSVGNAYTTHMATPYVFNAKVADHVDDLGSYRLSAFDNAYSFTFNDDQTEVTFAVGNSYNKGTTNDDLMVLPYGFYTVPVTTAGDPGTADTGGIGYMKSSREQSNLYYNNIGFEWNADGSEFYKITKDDGRIYEFSPYTNYGVAANSPNYITGEFSRSLNTTSSGISSFQFNSDGTKCFICDQTLKCIFTFSLSTAYDITSKTDFKPDNVFAPSDTSSWDSFTMNPAGTKIQVVLGGVVRQYSLTTAYDLSTASATFDTTTLTVDSDIDSGDIAWGDNGNYFYRLTDGTTSSTLKRYSCSTAYDITTANATPDKTFTFGTFTIGSSTFQTRMFFKPDGLKLYTYALSYNSNTEYVFQWDLSTAWDISTIGSTTTPDASKTLSLVNDSKAAGLHFKSDGSILIIRQRQYLYRFDLTTNWDLSTIPSTPTQTYNGQALPGGGDAEEGLFMTDDGTKLFYGCDSLSTRMIRTDMSTGYDFKTISHDGGSNVWYFADPFIRSTIPHTASGFSSKEFRFGDSGSKLYMLDENSTSQTWPRRTDTTFSGDVVVNQWNLSTAYDLSTATWNEKYIKCNGALATTSYTFDISSNGLHWIFPSSGDLYMGTMTTPWDITTLGSQTAQQVNGVSWGYNGFTDAASPAHSVRWSSDGTAIWTSMAWGSSDVVFLKLALSTAYDPTTASHEISGNAKYLEVLPTVASYGSFPWTSTSSLPWFRNIKFANDGYNLYAIEISSSQTVEQTRDIYIRAFELTTAYDITTATELTSAKLWVPPSPPDPNGLNPINNLVTHNVGPFCWNADGTRFFLNYGNYVGEFKV
jgi:hypothetical protein